MADTARTDEDAPPAGSPALKRVMGPGLLLLFIVGDILGTGIYALTGTVAAEVGGVVWLPFLVAFLVALITAFSYLELVTKYPQAAGAALYTHKAFGIHFLTFLVAFAVMSSGHHLGVHGGPGVQRQRRRGVRPRPRRGHRHHADRPGLHDAWSRWSTSAASARASRPTSCSPASSSPAC